MLKGQGSFIVEKYFVGYESIDRPGYYYPYMEYNKFSVTPIKIPEGYVEFCEDISELHPRRISQSNIYDIYVRVTGKNSSYTYEEMEDNWYEELAKIRSFARKYRKRKREVDISTRFRHT